MAKKELAETDEESVIRSANPLTAKDVLDAFKAGDAVGVRTMEKVGEILGAAIGTISCVMDPEAVVIGGGVSKAGQPLIDVIQKYYKMHSFRPSKNTPIVLATLGNDAGIYGAARMVISEE